jgi:CPA2 family monovalent cation:H+ antiporter-2
MHDSLQVVIVLLAVAVPMVVAFRHFGLPPLLGYMLVGTLIGPHALGWIPDSEDTRYLAEFGVGFLMFTIGLEFSLPKLLTLRRMVFGLGAAQVAACMLMVIAIAVALGIPWQAGMVLGGALAMSSTAILAKSLAERQELATQHGRQIISVLLFQDLAVVPLLIVAPALSSPGEALAYELGFALFKGALVLVALLLAGQRVMRPWFHLVGRQKSPELFVLNVLLITIGLAALTELAGLSLALGAFLAGMLISETEYRVQVEEDIKPFRDVLLGLFFVTIGMTIDLAIVWDHLFAIVVLLVAYLLAKGSVIAGVARLFGSDAGVALRVGTALAAAGEFGFVLLRPNAAGGAFGDDTLQIILAVMLISLAVAPLAVDRGAWLARHFSGSEWMNRAMQVHNIAVQSMDRNAHVVICGYGRSGQNLGRLLEQEGVQFIALDFDSTRVREAAAAGESVVFGDAARREVLIAAGLLRAQALVVSYADTGSALKILNYVHELRPDLPVIVRTWDATEIARLKDAGASEVVPEILEGSLMLAAHTLMHIGLPFSRVMRRIRETRAQRYALFHGFFRGASDGSEGGGSLALPQLRSFVLQRGAYAIGRRLAELDLHGLGVEVTAVRKRQLRGGLHGPDTVLEEGDVIVLLGAEPELAASETRLLQG